MIPGFNASVIHECSDIRDCMIDLYWEIHWGRRGHVTIDLEKKYNFGFNKPCRVEEHPIADPEMLP